MKAPAQGFRVGVLGASSLLGKELLAVLKERDFPVARLVTAEDDEGEPEMPVVDLREGFEPSITDESLSEKDFDLVFVAAPPRPFTGKSGAQAGEPPFLRSPAKLARASHCTVIDLGEGLAGEPGGIVSIPFLERAGFAGRASVRESVARGRERPSGFYVSAHPATIVLSSLLLRLAARFALRTEVAQVFGPASEFGPQAVEELQRQTSSLLSFQKLPEAVFGQQLAFNLLPRFGRGRPKGTTLRELERRIHEELRAYLGERAPLPALRLFQAPVFHSLAFSLYVETDKPAPVESLAQALEGERIEIRRLLEQAPSQVEASGSSDILVDALTSDASHANGVWIWAAADNLRLSAVNAVEIAETVGGRVRS